jgi:glycosyltransferase involved in cell wall biosynthesis/tetratricopeptide (TPR) repeat protein
MGEHAAEDREDEQAALAALVASLFELSASAAPPEESLTAFHRLLRDEQPAALHAEIDGYLASNDPSLRSSLRVLEYAARGGHTIAGLRIADRLLEKFGYDESLVDIRLRFLLGLTLWGELIAECEAALSRGPRSIHLVFRVLLSLYNLIGRAERDIGATYRKALSMYSELAAGSRDSPIWWARYYREIGNGVAALRSYRALIEPSAEANHYRAAALREGAELALSGNRWGRDAPFLLRAAEEGVTFKLPWRAAAAAAALGQGLVGAGLDGLAQLPGTNVYSHVHDTVGSPESAFDYLIDEVLPARCAYEPKDTLLMIGTSLSAGGMERIFANSYRAVKSAGAFEHVRLALLTFDFPGPTAFYLPETGVGAGEIVRLYSYQTPETPVSMLPTTLARRVWPAYQLIQQERPRVIHAWNDTPGIIAAFAGLLAGCPRIVVHFHHMRAINLSTDTHLIRSFPSCYRRLLERPEMELLFVADASARDYADWWSVEPSAKFRRLYNGFTDVEAAPGARETLRRDMGFGPGALVLGTVFRFEPVKRPALWIAAAARVAERLSEARFVMVGAGAQWEAARAQVASLGLSDRFHFPGKVRNVGDYLACMEVFMLTSQVEGLPNSLVEAQLAGVPVVTTDVGGARETFVPGVTGRLVDVPTPERLADAAIDCLTDKAWRERASVKARRMALARFGIDRYLTSLLANYGAS